MKVVVTKSALRTLLVLLLLASVSAGIIFAVPEGASIVGTISPETRKAPSPANITADGGNVTAVNISIATQTLVWQGFFGEINGSIVLQDASGDLFFSWNITNLSGEIFASRDNAVNFALIFPQNNCSIDNLLTGAGKSDSVNQTFFPSSNSNVFEIGTVTINASSVCSTHPYVSSSPTSGPFEEIILTDDPNNRSDPSVGGNTSVYVGQILDDTAGFDGGTHDYQLLVPVNRSTGFDEYFFYAELS